MSASTDAGSDDSGATTDAADLEWLTLEAGEEIVWAGGMDRRTLVPAYVIGIPMSIFVVGLFIIAASHLQVKNTDYVVTTRAVYKKTGTLSRDVQRIDFEKVQNISYSQSALGNHFGYGTVEISTAGGSGVEMEFRSVPDPRAVQERISERIKGRGDRTGEDDRGKDEVLGEILTELRAIREAVEGPDARTDGPELGDHE